MQVFLFSFSAVSFLISLVLFFANNQKKFTVKNFIFLKGIKKPKVLGLKVGAFGCKDFQLFSFDKNVFCLKLDEKRFLKIDVFIDEKPLNQKFFISPYKAEFFAKVPNNTQQLCVKYNFMEVLCMVHSTIKIVIEKNDLSFAISAQKRVLKFDDFFFDFSCDGKLEQLEKSQTKIIYIFKNCKRLKVDYSSLNLNKLGKKQILDLAHENFAIPKLDFPKPNFRCFGCNNLQGKYVDACVKYLNFEWSKPVDQKFVLNLSELCFTDWIVLKRYKKIISLCDIKTNFCLKIKTDAKVCYLSRWNGQMFLCLDKNYYVETSCLSDYFKGNNDIFRLKLNYKMFNQKYWFKIAFGMLTFMNKMGNSIYLKDEYTSSFILGALPKKLMNTKSHYLFVRAIYPYIKHKELKNKLLLFMQNFEQMFTK